MGLLDLFIVNNTVETEQKPVAKSTATQVTFPVQQAQTAPAGVPAQVNTLNPHLQSALELYEKGFESLNQPGFDFFEFFQMVSKEGVGQPSVYQMAFNMGIIMNKSLTKQDLLSHADKYLTEIEKVYQGYVQTGNQKQNEVLTQKNSENSSLQSELSMLSQQLEMLQNEIRIKQEKLSGIDQKYDGQLTDIQNKISANDQAKAALVNAITTVKNGIIANVK